MSRKIKYRVWDEEKKKYCTEYNAMTLKHDGEFCIERGWCTISGGFEVEQSTLLKDMNGKEIYEGDIVEQFVCGVREFKGKKCGLRTVWQVRWNETECCFELHYISGSLFGDSMMSSDDEYEVIGNIHENPELLEKGDEE